MNLCRKGEFSYKEEDMKERNIVYRHELWTADNDGEPLPPEELERRVEWIVKNVNDGKRVLVHCRMGQKRSVMVSSCALIVLEGISAFEAMNRIQEKRSGWLHPQQTLAVVNFAKRFNQQPEIDMDQMFKKCYAHNDLKKSKAVQA